VGTVFTVTACQFTGNTAAKEGGAIYAYGYSNSDYEFVNTLFVGNTAGNGSNDGKGGAVYNWSASDFINCTFVDNLAEDDGAGGQGGGIYNLLYTATITNCIFKNNEDGGGDDESSQIHVGSGTATVTYTALSACDTGAGGFCYDSNDNNVEVSAVFVDSGDHPYQLQGGASNDELIDLGLTSANSTSVDLAQADRKVDHQNWDDDCEQESEEIDMGAYEVECPE